jgi:hypothetical protein
MRYGTPATLMLAALDLVFFGHSITQISVMRKTKNVREINSEYYAWIINSLVQNRPLYNRCSTQAGIPQGNEHHVKSSIFLKMTANMLVEMPYHWQHSNLMALSWWSIPHLF